MSTEQIKTDMEYVKTPNGILRMVEAALCVIGFICAAVYGAWFGIGFVQFATISGFVVALIYFFVNLFAPNITNYRPLGLLVEAIVSAVYGLILLIAGIVAAATPKYYFNNGAAAAAAAFSFFAAIAFIINAVLLFREWSASRTESGTTTTSGTAESGEVTK